VRGALVVVSMLGLAGCDLIFSLDGPPISPPCTAEGLELCLAFEGSIAAGTTNDESGKRNNAILTDVAVAKRGTHGAVTLGPTSLIEVTTSNTLDFTGSFSFDAFYRLPDGPTGLQSLVDCPNQYGIAMDRGLNLLSCTVIFEAVAEPFVSIATTTFVPDDRWHHVACVYDDSLGMTLYSDGVAVSNDPRTGTVRVGDPGRFRIGSFVTATAHFIGDADDVRVFDRVLDPDEILEAANAL
jgi:hypothetical protein